MRLHFRAVRAIPADCFRSDYPAQGRAMPPQPFDRLDYARRVLRAEAATIDVVAGRLDDGFERVADYWEYTVEAK